MHGRSFSQSGLELEHGMLFFHKLDQDWSMLGLVVCKLLGLVVCTLLGLVDEPQCQTMANTGVGSLAPKLWK